MAAREFKKIKPVAASVQLLERQVTSSEHGVRTTGVDSVCTLRAPTDQLIDLTEKLKNNENWFVRRTASDILTNCIIHVEPVKKPKEDKFGKKVVVEVSPRRQDVELNFAPTKIAGRNLEDLDPEIQRCAARTLIAISAQPKKPLAGQSPLGEESADTKSLDDHKKADLFSSAAAEEIANRLSHEQWEVRQNAADALGRVASWAKPHAATLGLLIGDDTLEVRLTAVRAIGRLGSTASPGALTFADWLQHHSEPIRYSARCAIVTLGKHDGESAAAAVAPQLLHRNQATRRAAMCVLEELGPFAAPHSPEIVKCLEDSDINIRSMVARVFVAACIDGGKSPAGKIQMKSLKDIVKKMNSKDANVSRCACDTMRAMAPLHDKFARSQGRMFLEDQEGVNLKELAEKKLRAISVLSNACTNVEPYIEVVIQEMESKDWRLRRAVVHFVEDLGEYGQGLAAKEVSRRLLHAEPDVRRAAGEALGRMGLNSGEYAARVEALMDTEEDPDVIVVLQAAIDRLFACGALKDEPDSP